MMTVTTEQAQKIRLLSDTELYEQAVEFANQHAASKVSNAQLSGLQNAVGAGDWNEILRYVNNRLGRSTTTGGLKNFYQGLKECLDDLLNNRIEKIGLVAKSEGLKGAQKKQMNETKRRYAHLLAKEFIQHVIAEVNYPRQTA